MRKSPFSPKSKGSYRIENKAKEAVVYIYDEIGWFGIEAQQFAKDFSEIKADTIHVRINSPGGDVFDGTAIANTIKQHSAKTIVHIDGIAASISSIIALAGDEIIMAENAFFMFHEAWSIAIGNSEDFRKEADLLDKVDGVLAQTYVKKTGKEEDEIKDLMSAETWLTAKEALEMGMIDKIEGGEESEDVKATIFDLSVFANVPEKLRDIKEELNPRDLERALRNAGCSRSQAKEIMAKGFIADNQAARDAQVDNGKLDQTARDAQVEEPSLRDAEPVQKAKDRTADLLTRAEVMAPA
jgi:ATP-dependent protease ClpP protease subunit